MSENIMYKNIADKMKKANKEIEELKADNQELQDSITWWNNRYNALQRDYEDYKTRCEKAVEYINNFSVDKSFSFPLMKRWEENQVKSSIDYEFNDTLKKELLNILNGRSDKEMNDNMMKNEVKYLREHLREIYQYKSSMKDLTYDMSLELLSRCCIAFDYLQQKLQRKDNIHDKAINHIMNIFRNKNWFKEYDYDDLATALKDTLGILRGDKE